MEAKTTDQLWGGETTKAVENFQISGHPIPAPVIHWLGRIKAAAARANTELGNLDEELAERIAKAGEEVANGEHDEQFPNDVFPSAVHLAALGEVHSDLLPALDELRTALERKADEFAELVKAGRTHLMDAVPVTLGQEFSGYAAQIRLGAERVRSTLGRVGQIPLGGTATGTGLNTHPEFAAKVRERLSADTGLDISE